MSTCGRLFPANKIYAYFNAAGKHVVVLADVTLNPTADDVHICPNLIAAVGAHEFLVAGTTRPGIHPALAVIRRLSYSFATDATPRSVVVYSMGIDGPARVEVAVSSTPPAALPEDGNGAVKLDGGPTPAPIEVIGYSPTFSFEQAVEDALSQVIARIPPNHGDAAVELDIKDIFARTGHILRPGLFVRAMAK
jgi:hypothetical protein